MSARMRPGPLRVPQGANAADDWKTMAPEEALMSPMTRRVVEGRQQHSHPPSRLRHGTTAAGAHLSPPAENLHMPGSGAVPPLCLAPGVHKVAPTTSPTDMCMSPVSKALEKYPGHRDPHRPRRLENLGAHHNDHGEMGEVFGFGTGTGTGTGAGAGALGFAGSAGAGNSLVAGAGAADNQEKVSPIQAVSHQAVSPRHLLHRKNTPPALHVGARLPAPPARHGISGATAPASPADRMMSPATQFVLGRGRKPKPQRSSLRFRFADSEIRRSPTISAVEAAERAAAAFSSDDNASDDDVMGVDADEYVSDDGVHSPPPPDYSDPSRQRSSTPIADATAEAWAAKTPEDQKSELARLFLRRSQSMRRSTPRASGTGASGGAGASTRIIPSGVMSPSDAIMSPVTAALRQHFTHRGPQAPAPKLQQPPDRARARAARKDKGKGKDRTRQIGGTAFAAHQVRPHRGPAMHIDVGGGRPGALGMMSPSDQIMSPVSHALLSRRGGRAPPSGGTGTGTQYHIRPPGGDDAHAGAGADARADAGASGEAGEAGAGTEERQLPSPPNDSPRAGMLRNLSVSDLKSFVRGAFRDDVSEPVAPTASPMPSPATRRALEFTGHRRMGVIQESNRTPSPARAAQVSPGGAFSSVRSPPPPPPVPAATATSPSHKLATPPTVPGSSPFAAPRSGKRPAPLGSAAMEPVEDGSGAPSPRGDKVSALGSALTRARASSSPMRRSPSASALYDFKMQSQNRQPANRPRRSVSHTNLAEMRYRGGDSSGHMSPVSQRVLDTARKSRANRVSQLKPATPPSERPSLMSPPTKGVTARGRARSAASADIDPRSPPDSRAFAHALLRRRKPVPSPAPRRSRAASDYSGSSSRHRANGGAGASATGGSPRAPQLSSPSDDLVSPASQAVARVHRHQDAGGGERLPVRRWFGAGARSPTASGAADGSELAAPGSPERSTSSPARYVSMDLGASPVKPEYEIRRASLQ